MRVIEYRGRWCLELKIDGERKRFSLGLEARPELRKAAEREADSVRAQLARRVGPDCASIWESYLRESEALDKSRLENAWKALKPFFSKIDHRTISRDTCRSYAKERAAKGIMPGTIRKELSSLRAAVNWFDAHNKAEWDLPKPPQPKDLWITKEQFRSLLDAAIQPHVKLFMMLALSTAARKEALLDLTWFQVNFEQRTINLGRKEGGKSRAIVPITDDLMPYLQSAWKARTEDSHVITFRGKKVGSIQTAFEAAVKRANLPGVTPHTLRHSAATWMALDGVKIEQIARFLGHTDPRITWRTYAHHSPDYLAEAAKALKL